MDLAGDVKKCKEGTRGVKKLGWPGLSALIKALTAKLTTFVPLCAAGLYTAKAIAMCTKKASETEAQLHAC